MNAFDHPCIHPQSEPGDTGRALPRTATVVVEQTVVYCYRVELADEDDEPEALALARFRAGDLPDAGPADGEEHAVETFILTEDEPASLLDYDNWCEQWRPRQNLFNADAPFDGAMFETYGEELAHVVAAPERCVWTLIAEGEDMAIVNGLRFVNRLGYFVTEVPWPDGARIEIELD